MAGGKLVSVVFSFRNEEQNLSELIARAAKALEPGPEDYELIFVNDASTDRSLEILLAERAKNPRVKIITLSRRFGPSEGVLAGMSVASGDALIYMDSDLQDPPELLPELLNRWRAGADVIHTVRLGRRGETWLKKWVTKRAYQIIRFFSTLKLPVEAGDFKLLSRRALDQFLTLKEYDPYIRGLVAWIGFRQETVPYERHRRERGLSKFPLFSRNPAKAFITAITSFSFVPIYVIAIVGLIGTIGSVLGVATGLVMMAAGGASGSTIAFIALLTFFWATIIAAIGTLGLYLVRIYKEVRGRPRFIIQDKIGFDGKTSARG